MLRATGLGLGAGLGVRLGAAGSGAEEGRTTTGVGCSVTNTFTTSLLVTTTTTGTGFGGSVACFTAPATGAGTEAKEEVATGVTTTSGRLDGAAGVVTAIPTPPPNAPNSKNAATTNQPRRNTNSSMEIFFRLQKASHPTLLVRWSGG